VVAALLAAIMSTVDSQILVVASAVTRDLPAARRGKRPPDPGTAHRARWVSAALIVIAGLLAQLALETGEGHSDNPITGIVNMLVLFSWGGLGATIGPAMLLTVYDRRASGQSILTAMLVGGITACLWRGAVRPAVETWSDKPPWLAGLWSWCSYELTVAFPLALACGWLMARRPSHRTPARTGKGG